MAVSALSGWAEQNRWMRAVQQLAAKLARLARRPPRQLRLCESLALGERRFVAVVEFERQRFLIGGAAGSVALLAHLPAADPEQKRRTI